MKWGKFITLEGIDGVGKSTLVPYLEDALAQKGIPTIHTREPGGTKLAEAIRALLLGAWRENLNAQTELLLMFAARSQHVTEFIVPHLQEGEWVLCERFSDASLAYQGQARGIPDEYIHTLQDLIHPDCYPDLTLYLDIDIKSAWKRRKDRKEDRFERESYEFFSEARECYQELARTQDHIHQIDATQSIDEVARESINVVLEFVEKSQ